MGEKLIAAIQRVPVLLALLKGAFHAECHVTYGHSADGVTHYHVGMRGTVCVNVIGGHDCQLLVDVEREPSSVTRRLCPLSTL